MSKPQEDNPTELLDTISSSEEEANLSLSGVLKGVAEFKLAIGLIEAAVATVDQKTAAGIGALQTNLSNALKEVSRETEQALKHIRDEMRDPMNQADLASQVRDMIDRLGF